MAKSLQVQDVESNRCNDELAEPLQKLQQPTLYSRGLSGFLPFRFSLCTTISARPDSAPILHRRFHHDALLPFRERSPSWLPPRVTQLERETQDLLTACRKAGRDKGDATRWHNERFRHGPTTEEPPLRGSGESRRRSKHDNSIHGSWWGKMVLTACF